MVNEYICLTSPLKAAVELAPAMPIVLSGFFILTGASDGSQFTLTNVGPSTVRIAHDDVATAAAVLCPSVHGQILGVGGSVLVIYDAVVSKWRLFLITPGRPIDVPYNPADFSGSGGAWTVDAADIAVNQIIQEGALLQWTFHWVNTSVAAIGTLRCAIPMGFSPVSSFPNPLDTRVSDNGTVKAGSINLAAPNAQTATLYTDLNGGEFAASTHNTDVQGSLRFEIQ